MKKLFLLFTLMVLPLVASADDSGSCGGNVTYTYVEATNTLTISGTGAMGDYHSISSDCAPWYSYNRSIKTAIIENGVTSIGGYAFCGCSSLTSITIPNSVTSIGGSAFYNCTSLTSITIPNSVTSIGDRTFYYCSGLTSVSIGNSMTSIGGSAFYECTGLTSITIPNSVKSIDGNAFEGCSGLTSISVDNGNTFFDSRDNCNAIIHTKTNELRVGCKKTIIPNSVTSIGEGAFSGCGGLTSVTIPNSVTSIGGGAFSGCRGLTSITIPNSVTSIGQSAFFGCSGLTSITIPNSVTSIGWYAFRACNGLTTVTIGSGISSISGLAFYGCKELTDVYCYAEIVPRMANDAFDITYYGNITLHVPNASVNAYNDTEPWNYFGSIVGLNSTEYKLLYTVDGSEYKSYTLLEGAPISTEPVPAKEGYTFSGWSEIPQTMPAKDLTITGTFIPNKYKVIYNVDGEVYKTTEVAFATIITPEPAPTKDGYKFSGWSAIPATMPSEDVVITGSFEKVYDVGDLTGLLKYIMNRAGGVFSQLFDLNGDGELNIGDIVLMVKKIHQNQAARATSRARAASSLTADVDLSQFTAAQFILSTDEQAKVSAIRLNGKNRETHRVNYELMGNGQYSVVVYSTTNQLLTAEEGGLLEVELADGNVSSEVTTSNVVLSTPDSECLTMDSLPTGATTGINSLNEEADTHDVYNLNGGKEPKQGLRKGIYIIRGKKTVVR